MHQSQIPRDSSMANVAPRKFGELGSVYRLDATPSMPLSLPALSVWIPNSRNANITDRRVGCITSICLRAHRNNALPSSVVIEDLSTLIATERFETEKHRVVPLFLKMWESKLSLPRAESATKLLMKIVTDCTGCNCLQRQS